MSLHWEHDCPPDSQIWTELITQPDGTQFIRVSCDAPGDPPEPPTPPDTTGTAQGTIGDHHYSLDWQYKDGHFHILDLDITLSLDDEIG